MQLSYCRCQGKDDLEQILILQRKNLFKHVSPEIQEREGFVTVSHTYEVLRRMNDICPHIIAKDNDRLVGYALCMHPRFSDEIEVLKPMFTEISTIVSKDTDYIVMGQICIDKDYRKKGVFRKLYATMKKELQPEFDCIITEVDVKNTRSLNAHYAIGFLDLKTYTAKDQQWKLILLK